MKTFLLPIVAAVLASAAGASEAWSTNPAEAMQQAAAQKKGVMLEFTGSDWCGACIMQKTQAFSLPNVQAGIARSFIPVELDFPRKKQQDEQTKATLNSYKESYGITGFPSLIFTDAQGRPVHTVIGYGSPEQVLKDTERAEQALNNQQALTNKLAGNLSDQERRDTLVQLLKAVPQSSIRTFYKPAFEELAKLDPKDTAGIRTALERKDLLKSQTDDMVKAFRENNIQALMGSSPEEAIAFLTAYGKKDGVLPEIRQSVLFYKAHILMQQNRVNELEQPLKEALALMPDSDTGKLCRDLLDKLPSIKKERGNLKPGEQPPLPAGAIPAAKCIAPPAAAKK